MKMKTIKVLGPGCSKCQKLAENTRTAIDELGIECEFEKITDISEFIKYGILTTPALVVDGETRMSGKVLEVEEIKKIIR
jgi:small redox-active disulfide protein 2